MNSIKFSAMIIHTNFNSHQQCATIPISSDYQHFLFIFCYLLLLSWKYLMMILICILFDDNWYLAYFLPAQHLYSLLLKAIYLKYLLFIFNWVIYLPFLTIKYLDFLCSLDTKPLSDVDIINIFYYSSQGLYILLIVHCAEIF